MAIISNISKQAFALTDKHKSSTPIIGEFANYFKQFNTNAVLLVTDEDIAGDLRVLNQLAALMTLSAQITVYRVEPSHITDERLKKTILDKLKQSALKQSYLFPRFFGLIRKYATNLPWRQKAKQGICNDHDYLVSTKIDTHNYSLVVCNNLIAINAVQRVSGVQYVYDMHEFELFRNRKKPSVQRSFYNFLTEREILHSLQHVIAISEQHRRFLIEVYQIPKSHVTCIYNQNFEHVSKVDNSSAKEQELLVYIGNVNKNRGLQDIIQLSYKHHVLVIACTYDDESLRYLQEHTRSDYLMLFKGLDYHEFLQQQLKNYRKPYFLILINPETLSYRDALPNKFFQAQALGLPIIVYDYTYLAQLVKTYRCGLIYAADLDGEGFSDISMQQYRAMSLAMTTSVQQAISKKIL